MSVQFVLPPMSLEEEQAWIELDQKLNGIKWRPIRELFLMLDKEALVDIIMAYREDDKERELAWLEIEAGKSATHVL
jgi:hypothetical protein